MFLPPNDGEPASASAPAARPLPAASGRQQHHAPHAAAVCADHASCTAWQCTLSLTHRCSIDFWEQSDFKGFVYGK